MAVAEKETLGFQAEVKQLLQLMIHSLYSNKEIFLRELISNASDAADKMRFEAINNDALYGNDHELKIKVSFDKEAKTVTISDNGTGVVNPGGSGVGWISMTERAAEVGGSCSITNRPEGGLAVCAVFPLREEADLEAHP